MKGKFVIKLGAVILGTFLLAPVFVQAKEKGKTKPDIIVTCPKANQRVCSPLVVQGKARGSWFFEATFPMSLVDAQGNQLATSKGKALGEWTTEKFVPFEGKLEFSVTKATKAKLILENDNPSGLPENKKKKEIPVILVPGKK